MLSVVIIAKNEEANIKRCLESILWADEIIVLDSGSTDRTVDIAKAFTKQIVTTEEDDWQGYGVQKQRALALANGDWVLNLDADESVDEALKNEIIEAINSNTADAFRIPIQMVFYGKLLRYSSSPKRHIRLFKRKDARYSGDIVHEKIILPPQSSVGQLHRPIRHHSFQDVSHFLYKMNKYSSLSAKTKLHNNKKTSLFRTLLGTSWMFLRCYVLQKGFMDGKAGFLFAVFNAQGTFYRGVKQLYPDKITNDTSNRS